MRQEVESEERSMVLTILRTARVELELELIQTDMTQKPMLRVEVGAVSCSSDTNRRG